MANWSVSNTFTNSTTADASQVNTNFTDLINCSSDGTKDMSIAAITAAGTATFNGNVNLGNASSDDLTITASLASTINIKTTYSYDIGSATLGLRSIYLGSSDSAARSTRLIGATVASSWTMTLPVSAGTSRYRLETDGAGVTSWQPVRRSPSDAQNYGISCSVAGSALTIALKGADGSDASSTNPVDIVFRNSTAATGTPSTQTVTGALTLTISSGSTLGHTSATDHYIYVYAIDNSGTVELAASSSLFDEGTVKSTTAEGGGGAADSNAVMYSTTARTSKAIRLLGRMKSNQTTAGTWAAVPTEISLPPFRKQLVTVRYTASSSFTISDNTVTVVTQFDTKDIDTHKSFDTSTGKFTAPAAGIYRLNTCIDWAGNATGARTIYVKYNGSSTSRVLTQVTSVGGAAAIMNGSTLYNCAVGDTIEIELQQSSGGALNAGSNGSISTYIEINQLESL